ncbi:hypothetical protein GE061_000532 [Apolygus lucorum]|uniref:DUF4773 domain-containing protein n=1 Tax=Apolygus lucorum TaxID=248454 RepID=A0A8S9Y4I7_APOLU|nr:hypothetical protein GE061_000532 [Apolygus lucorum]
MDDTGKLISEIFFKNGIVVLCSQSKNIGERFLRSNGKSLSSAGQTTREGMMHQIGDKLGHLELTINELFTKIADAQNVCHRNGNTLKCCADDLLQNNVCVAFALTLSNFTVRVIFEVNNSTFIDEEISEQEPDPICGGLPHLHIIKFCFEPYNLAYVDETLNVCLAISGRIGAIEKDITRVDLNCFLFSRYGTISLVKPTTNATNTGIINFRAP